MRRTALLLLLIAPAVGSADDVYLKNGGRITGVILTRSDEAITLEVGPGRVTLSMARVARVVAGNSVLATYRERARALAPTDAAGWLDLGLWAHDNDLLTQARDAFERVLALDPQNATAHRALGDVSVGNRWMSLEDSYRAQGLVLFAGSWVTPEERTALLRSREDEAAAARVRAEADARIREAQARADAAEADARRADAQAANASQGVPILPIGAVGPSFGNGCCAVGHVRVRIPPRCTTPAPAPSPPRIVTPQPHRALSH